MKTLILNGSPRKNGDTAALIAEARRHLKGDVTEVSAFRQSLACCIDCRYCWKHDGCAVQDDMQQVYDMLRSYDNLIIAAPLYFSELPAPMLAVASRLQRYWAARVMRKETPVLSAKNGLLLLAGGGDGAPEKAVSTARAMFNMSGTTMVGQVAALHTDKTPAGQDDKVLADVREAALLLNRLYDEKSGGNA